MTKEVICGRVNIDDYEYYIVTKKLASRDRLFGLEKYNPGERLAIRIKDIEQYSEEARRVLENFLENNCYKATKDSVRRPIYEEIFENVIVIGSQYDSDCIDNKHIYSFYIPNLEFDFTSTTDKWSVLKQYGMDFNDRNRLELVAPEQCCYEKDRFQNPFFENVVPENCRKATVGESFKMAKRHTEMENARMAEFEQEYNERKRQLQAIYETHKSDSNYFPGACGNFHQVLTDENYKPKSEKLYDLYAIRHFYKDLMRYIPDNILEKMILYGGTVPYLLTDARKAPRKFGDVDIFIPIENMWKFRNYIMYKSYFTKTYDSLDLTRFVQLTNYWNTPWPKETRYIPITKDYRIKDDSYKYQDYGFKGKLFGVNISVFPIYQWTKGSYNIPERMDICGKSFRIGENRGENKFLLNTIITHDTPIQSFSHLVKICGGTIGVAPLEYTIASKQSAIEHGFKLREESDLVDLEFINDHRKLLGIDEGLVEHYMNNIPEYGITKVYRLKRNYEIDEMSPESYRNFVTQNRHYPS